MGQDAEQGVGGQRLALLQGHQQQGEQHAADGHRQRQVDVQHQAEGDAEQRGVGQGVAEIGHAPPDDKGAERASDQRRGEAGEQRVEKEIGHLMLCLVLAVRAVDVGFADHHAAVQVVAVIVLVVVDRQAARIRPNSSTKAGSLLTCSGCPEQQTWRFRQTT